MHSITVGKGGLLPVCRLSCLPSCTASCIGTYSDITHREGLSGESSSINTLYVASGGTGGGTQAYSTVKSDGGSGGGSGASGRAAGNVGSSSWFRNISGVSTNPYVRASPGGRGSDDTFSKPGYFSDNAMAGGGGGGAGSRGQDFVRGAAWGEYTAPTRCSKTLPLSNCGNCGGGGTGITGVTTPDGVFDFAKVFGTAYTSKAVSNFIAGGGAGGAMLQSALDAGLSWPDPICLGGRGGGGNGYRRHRSSASDAGVQNTGSGGGGGGTFSDGGVGGSGLVLVKVSFVNCICSPGTFQGDNWCIPCPTGTYSTGYGLTECLACAPGTYNNNTGKSSSSVCLECTEGTYSPSSGTAECSECAYGKYNTYKRAVACDPWTVCNNGFYTFGGNNTSPGTCQACTNV
jgi:hypothetical protein